MLSKHFKKRVKYYYAGFGLVICCIYLLFGAIAPIVFSWQYKSFFPLLGYLLYPLALAACECLADYIERQIKENKNNGNS